MINIPDWCMTTTYQSGCVVFASDDIAYINIWSFDININLNPINLIGWKVWKRYKYLHIDESGNKIYL